MSAFAAHAARADVQIGNMSVTSPITDPLSNGITVNYSLFGSKFGVGAASAQLSFYLSTTSDGSSGVFPLDSRQLLLNGTGLGPYLPPSGTQSTFLSSLNFAANTRAFLQSLCQPQALFIIGQVDTTLPASTSAQVGHVVLPDFSIPSGTMTPSTIAPGGSVSISFTVATGCPASVSSRVGVFLADASFNLLSFIGAVTLAPGGRTYSVGPLGITFSSSIPTGSYNVVLIADVDGVVTESNESNNAGAFALTIAQSLVRGSEPAGLDSDFELPDDPADIRELSRHPGRSAALTGLNPQR
jgi:hypothetical protein